MWKVVEMVAVECGVWSFKYRGLSRQLYAEKQGFNLKVLQVDLTFTSLGKSFTFTSAVSYLLLSDDGLLMSRIVTSLFLKQA
jgi:hypothetical protein